MGLVLVTPASTFPVTRAEAKTHCRVDTDVDDSLIDGLIAAATDYVEQYIGRAILSQTWKVTLDEFSEAIMLPKGPVQTVSSVQYYDTAGDVQTVSSADYTLDNTNDPAWIVLNSSATWPATIGSVNAVFVTYTAGYSAAPAAIKQAMLLLIGLWYDARAAASERAMTEMPHAVEALLCNYRAFT